MREQVFILDPCHVASDAGQADTERLVNLRSLHRVRTMLTAVRSAKRRVDISQGILIGNWRPLSHKDEFDQAFFACYEFLEAMRYDSHLQEHPTSWAREPILL